MFAFGAEEPESTRMGGVEMYAAGKRALEQRETVTEGMEGLLAPGHELALQSVSASSCLSRPRIRPSSRDAA